ncbi:MAG TPA: BTAD domain-containing putative transcriptional regulator [Luteimicrobium sp.]|nr:BTAD domain-containing putative transcriptional regulator [Luteimicrobium sp.]
MSPDGHRGARLELRLIGPFQVRVEGRVRPLPHSVERVLALVALVGPLARSHASALLWPDAAPSRAGANLRAALSRLADVAAGFVHVSGEVLALAEEASVDLEMALAWINATIYDTTFPATSAPPSWIGRTLLPGWEDHWLDAPNERLQMLEAQALATAAEQLLAAGHPDEALPYALAAVDVQPWSESANRLTIEIHARRGDPSNALRHYRRFHRVLEQELGVAPGPDIRAAIRQLYPFGNPLVPSDDPLSR